MTKKGIIAIFSITVCVSFSPFSYANNDSSPSTNDKVTSNQCIELENRLNGLEPPEPITILKLPEQEEAESKVHYPSKIFSISDVISRGTKIPYNVIKNETNYQRPVYEEQWHSKYWGGRWSYVPSRIHYALHRLFTTYDIGISGELNFQQNVGIIFPTLQNQTDLDLYIVVFQTDVMEIYTKGNQVVVVGTPKRNGVDVLTVKTRDIHPNELKKLLLIQLATNTYELDYSLIKYEPPDFWFKQINRNTNLRWFKNTFN